MAEPLPLEALSRMNEVKPSLQRGPDYPEVLAVREIGGPRDPADRRMVLDTKTLEHLLDVARASLSGRVVVHHAGLRVQTLRDRETGHRWENVLLIGSEAKPEVGGLFGVHRG